MYNKTIMTRFIRLTNMIINTRYIRKIYYSRGSRDIIYMREDENISGNFLWISSDFNDTKFDKNKYPEDFKILEDFMNSMNKE